MFSRKSKYALHACTFLARHSADGPQQIATIAREEALPKKFIEVILLDLRHAGLLKSIRGRDGGYELAKPAHEIAIMQIIKAIDGPLIPFRCVAIRSDKTCEGCRDARTCPVAPLMRRAFAEIAAVFEAKTLADLARDANFLEFPISNVEDDYSI
ncbi:MAG: Rrf2 family transcriptional regulator [Candidatus Sumerlaeia bacterium]|nr:Rrf2 family transcriptional regulator [Candidatus Sumerlaeia bacterium]